MLNLDDPWELDCQKIKFKAPPHCSQEVTSLSWSGHPTGSIFSASVCTRPNSSILKFSYNNNSIFGSKLRLVGLHS